MLSLQGINIEVARYQWYGGKKWHSILKNISLELAPGEIVALVGGSGEGKSLLLQSLLNILPSNMRASGKVQINQEELSLNNFQRKYQEKLCYLPQGVQALNPVLTIEQHLRRACMLSGLTWEAQKVEQLLDSYLLNKKVLDQYPRQISGGMAKRIFSCHASLSKASYLLADEITAWLDEDLACQTLDSLRSMCQQGIGVLWVTHDLMLASEYADRIVFLSNGCVTDYVCQEKLRNSDVSHEFKKQWLSIPEKNMIFS